MIGGGIPQSMTCVDEMQACMASWFDGHWSSGACRGSLVGRLEGSNRRRTSLSVTANPPLCNKVFLFKDGPLRGGRRGKRRQKGWLAGMFDYKVSERKQIVPVAGWRYSERMQK